IPVSNALAFLYTVYDNSPSGGKPMATIQAAPVVESGKAPAIAAVAPKRYLALDAYRGFIMFILVSGGFGLRALARNRPAYAWIAGQFDHKPWEWIAFWDLIQPAFMFMVGVAMPFALLFRKQQGATDSQLFRHVGVRALR